MKLHVVKISQKFEKVLMSVYNFTSQQYMYLHQQLQQQQQHNLGHSGFHIARRNYDYWRSPCMGYYCRSPPHIVSLIACSLPIFHQGKEIHLLKNTQRPLLGLHPRLTSAPLLKSLSLKQKPPILKHHQGRLSAEMSTSLVLALNIKKNLDV